MHVQGPEECRAQPAGSLGALAVTGGLGALGRLVTVWAAGRTPRLLLTGRSGRPALGPPLAGLASWRCVAVQARCDLGTQEDRRQLVRFSPYIYIHAGAAGFPAVSLHIVDPPAVACSSTLGCSACATHGILKSLCAKQAAHCMTLCCPSKQPWLCGRCTRQRLVAAPCCDSACAAARSNQQCSSPHWLRCWDRRGRQTMPRPTLPLTERLRLLTPWCASRMRRHVPAQRSVESGVSPKWPR